MTTHTAINPPPLEETTAPRSPSRARALLSTADFQLLRAALASHARVTSDTQETAKINALFHRLGSYT